MTDDLDIFFRYIFKASKINISDKCYYYYDLNNSSLTYNFKNIQQKKLYKEIKVTKYLKEILSDLNLFEFVKIPFTQKMLRLSYLNLCSPQMLLGINFQKVKPYIRKYIKLLELDDKDILELDDETKKWLLFFS